MSKAKIKRLFEKLECIKPRFSCESIIVVCAIFQVICTLYFIIYDNDRLFFNDIPEIQSKLPIKKSCNVAMRSILQRKASLAIFDNNIINLIEDSNYDFFDFEGEEELFDIIAYKALNKCTVIITDKLGDRFFTFYFKGTESNQYIYGRYIYKIDEITYENLTKETL